MWNYLPLCWQNDFHGLKIPAVGFKNKKKKEKERGDLPCISMRRHTWSSERGAISMDFFKHVYVPSVFEGLPVMPRLQKAQWWLIPGTVSPASLKWKNICEVWKVIFLLGSGIFFFFFSRFSRTFVRDYLHGSGFKRLTLCAGCLTMDVFPSFNMLRS